MDETTPLTLHDVLKRTLLAIVAAVLWTSALLAGVAVLPWTLGVASVAILATAVSLTPTVLLIAMGDPWRPRLRLPRLAAPHEHDRRAPHERVLRQR